MRIAVIGAGGTGGYFGALMARAGEDVTFVARGAHLDAIRKGGLTVRSQLSGDFHVACTATDNTEEIGPVDLVLFCVKAYDTEQALAHLRLLVGPETMILSVQNGIDNEAQISRAVGPGHVLGAVAHVSSVIAEPGVISQTAGPGRITFGEMDGRTRARTERLLETFRRAGIAAAVHPDITAALWEKFIFICAMSGVTALTRLPIGPILADPESAGLVRDVMAEVEAVALAKGIAVAGYTDKAMAFMVGLEPAMRGSMYYDLAAGRRLELSTLNGTVVRLGRETGIPTPLNGAIYAALRPYEHGRPPGAGV
jgi:2-dehydropantoate 2-reductase